MLIYFYSLIYFKKVKKFKTCDITIKSQPNNVRTYKINKLQVIGETSN